MLTSKFFPDKSVNYGNQWQVKKSIFVCTSIMTLKIFFDGVGYQEENVYQLNLLVVDQ